MKSYLQQLEIKNKIREWWDDPNQDYDGIAGHGVNSEILELCSPVSTLNSRKKRSEQHRKMFLIYGEKI